MTRKWQKITSIYLVLVAVSCKVTLSASQVRVNGKKQSGSKRDAQILVECTTPNSEDGYCVDVYNCLTLVQSLNETNLNERLCGPVNENRNRRRICCEKTIIQFMHTVFLEPEETCGDQNLGTPSRIVGGENSSPGEFPWMARLQRKNSRDEVSFSCTGALVNSKVVLTSAHCIKSSGLDPLGPLYAVDLGDHEAECAFGNAKCRERRKRVRISKAISHPGYNVSSLNHNNDIGLIILKDAVAMTDFISSICILTEPLETDMYYISGWGKTESGAVSTAKMKVFLPPYSWEQCVDKYKELNVTLTANHLCAGGVKNKDSCQGDSGGPLMVVKEESKWFVAGVVSFGLGCGKEGWPGVYTNVPNYIKWINNEISNL